MMSRLGNRLQWVWIREEYTTLEASKALINALSDLLSPHTKLIWIQDYE